MKKVLSFVLVLALVLGSFSMAFAAAPTDVVGTDWETAVAALVELGVVNGYEDGSYKPAQAVTRAEAAKLVVTALGLEAFAGQNTATFLDTQNHWAQGFIGYAEALGLIKGDGNGYFRPNDTVSYQEMATILVRSLGYTDDALPGEWPANYVVRARAVGIMDNVAQAGNAAANRGDVAVMIYNNLENRIGYVDKDGAFIQYSPADTMLGRLSRAVYNNGDEFVLGNNELAIAAEGVNLYPYLGAKVVAFSNGETGSKERITGIKEVISTFITIADVDVAKYTVELADGTTYKLNHVLELDGANLGVTLDAIYYNGANANMPNSTTAGITMGALTNKTLAVEISGNYIEEVDSIMTWTAEKVLLWDEDAAKALANKNQINKKDFVMTNKDEINTNAFVLNGVASLDDIDVDDVVTYYMDGDNIIRVDVSKNTVEGTVTKVTGGNKYTINGRTYRLDGTSGSDNGDVDLGAEGTFYLAYNGRIAFTDVKTTVADQYAIVTVAAGVETSVAFGETASHKVGLLTADGKSTIYVIDGDTAGVTTAALATASPAGTIIKYALNSDGEVTTVAAVTSTAATKYTANGLMDGFKVADDVVVFVQTGTTKWKVGTIADVPVDSFTGTNANKVYFITNAKTNLVECIYLDKDLATTDDTYGVVIGAGEVFKDENSTTRVTEFTLLIDGAEQTIKATSALSANLTPGSLGLITFENGLVKTIEAVTDPAIGVTAAGYSAGLGVKVCTAGGAYYNNEASTTVAGSAIVETASDVVVYVWDAKNETYVVGDLSDIAEGDMVYMYQLDKNDKDGVDVVIVVPAE